MLTRPLVYRKRSTVRTTPARCGGAAGAVDYPPVSGTASGVTVMKYAAVIEYSQDKAKVEAARPAHRAYLTTLVDKDQLFASGPFEDGFGALIVYEADSPEAVEELMRADPFHAAGVFVRWTVRPWKMVFSNPRLMPG